MKSSLIANSPLAESVSWLALLLTGSIGTAIAVLAVAAVGLAMLLGRIAVRDGARIVLGAFVLFGAPMIAQALASFTQPVVAEPQSSEIYSAPPITLPKPPEPNRDPYAGASVPM